MPKLVGLNDDELIRCKELFRYFRDMHLVRGVPWPVDCNDRNGLDESLEYMKKMEKEFIAYENILGKNENYKL